MTSELAIKPEPLPLDMEPRATRETFVHQQKQNRNVMNYVFVCTSRYAEVILLHCEF